MRPVLSALALVLLLVGAVAAAADDAPALEVGPPSDLPSPLISVGEADQDGETLAVLGLVRSARAVAVTTATDEFVVELGDAGLSTPDSDVAASPAGVLVGRVSGGVLRLDHVELDGTPSPPVPNVAGPDAVVTEVAITRLGARFLVTWVEADATDVTRMQVRSRTYLPGAPPGPVRDLSDIRAGDSVGALQAKWHPGRGEALVTWSEGPAGLATPLSSRRIIDETTMTREFVREDIGLLAGAVGERWNLRLDIGVHGPDEWLVNGQVFSCSLPCEYSIFEPRGFLAHGDVPGTPVTDGVDTVFSWNEGDLVGSVTGPTLLVQHRQTTREGPATVLVLEPGGDAFVEIAGGLALDGAVRHLSVVARGGDTFRAVVEVADRAPFVQDVVLVEPATTTPTTMPTPPSTTPPSTTPPTTPPTPTPVEPGPTGYWMVDGVGNVYPFGAAVDAGGIVQPADLGGAEIVDIEPTTTGDGYWVLLSDQQVRTFGDAVALHAGSDLAPGESATSMSADPDGDGYWIFTDRGRALAYGTAVHHGDMTGVALNGPVIGSIATPTGDGYYMVASDGGIFAFGDAEFFGSMGGVPLNGPVVGLAPTPSGDGYWLVATDGGIFAFGDAPFLGSMGSTPLNRPVNGMVAYGGGYLMVASDGGIFVFGPADFHGSLGAAPPPDPVVAVAAIGE